MRTAAEIIRNSKSEFRQTPLVRVVATNSLQEKQTSAARQSLGAAAGSSSQGRSGRGGRGHREEREKELVD